MYGGQLQDRAVLDVPAEGRIAVWYLVGGDGPSQPYYAVINSQGRVAGEG